MRTNIDDAFLTFLVLLVLGSFAVAGCPGVVEAQEHGSGHDAEDLWRVCVHEAALPVWRELPNGELGWASQRTGEAWGGDCFGIHEVFLRGAAREGTTYGRFARRYSGRIFEPLTYDEHALAVSRGQEGLPMNRWASFLRTDGHEPTGWPSAHRRWTGEHGGQAAAAMALELCRFIASRTLEHVDAWSIAEHPIDDWGGRLDSDHATDVGLVLVAVTVPTANTFYARPTQIALREPRPE